MSEVYVLWWKYSDGSAAGIYRAYADKGRADEDMNLLENASSSKEYRLETVSLFGVRAPGAAGEG